MKHFLRVAIVLVALAISCAAHAILFSGAPITVGVTCLHAGAGFADGCAGAPAQPPSGPQLAGALDIQKVQQVTFAPGAGYTNGTGYALTATGCAGSGFTGTVDVVSGHLSNPVVTNKGLGFTCAPSIAVPATAGAGSGGSLSSVVYQTRPPWDVAGVDYYVGAPFGATLTSWESLPTTHLNVTTGQGGTVACKDTSAVTMDHIDFTVDGGVGEIQASSGTCSAITITNSKFGCSTSGASGNISQFFLFFIQNSLTLTLQNNTFDWTGCETNQTGAGGSNDLISMSAGGAVALKYNYFKHNAGRVTSLGGTVSSTSQFNAYDGTNYDLIATASTNAITAVANNILHFATTPSSLQLNSGVFDATNSAAFGTGGSLALSHTTTTVTLSDNAQVQVAVGDVINFTEGNHQNFQEFGASAVNNALVAFNMTYTNIQNFGTGGEGFQFYCDQTSSATCTSTNPTFQNNTMVGFCCFSNMVHGTAHGVHTGNGGTTLVGTGTNSQNYFDPTGTGNAVGSGDPNVFYNGSFTNATLGAWVSSGNIDMRDGTTITPQ